MRCVPEATPHPGPLPQGERGKVYLLSRGLLAHDDDDSLTVLRLDLARCTECQLACQELTLTRGRSFDESPSRSFAAFFLQTLLPAVVLIRKPQSLEYLTGHVFAFDDFHARRVCAQSSVIRS